MAVRPLEKILESKLEAVQFLRKQYKLDKPGQMKEAIKILHDWIQKQNHLKKKDFTEHYYELIIFACKGSLERAKALIDKQQTMRTLLPQFFGNYNVKTDFSLINEIFVNILLPKFADDYYRVEVMKIRNRNPKCQFMDFYRLLVIMTEFIKNNDLLNGLIIVVDLTETNLMDLITALNLIELRQAATIFIECYGIRIKSVHIVTPSKFIDALITIVKQIFSPKIVGRVRVHKTIEGIHEFIPKSILPKDFGGEERSLKELQENWIEFLSSEEHLEYMREINKGGTDESRRQSDKFIEQYAGMPGTFRQLTVD